MDKMMFIIKYEYKMQMKRFVTWVVLFIAIVIAFLDSFPSASNLARLEFLPQPDYFLYRIMSIDGLILVFALVFLQSDRFSIDIKTGVKSLFMATPLNKKHYILGKLFAGFLYTITIIMIFLFFNIVVYYAFSPTKVAVVEYILPFIKTIFFNAIPVSIFISFCAVAIPAIIDIRLFYFIISILFIINATITGSAEKMPFYLITSGDLIKLIWQHPKYPFNDMNSIIANLSFLIGGGLLASVFILCKGKFWRAE